MDNKELIEQVLEGQGLSPEQVAELIAELGEIDFGSLDPTMPSSKWQQELELQARMAAENDWRQRAALAAKIISMRLE